MRFFAAIVLFILAVSFILISQFRPNLGRKGWNKYTCKPQSIELKKARCSVGHVCSPDSACGLAKFPYTGPQCASITEFCAMGCPNSCSDCTLQNVTWSLGHIMIWEETIATVKIEERECYFKPGNPIKFGKLDSTTFITVGIIAFAFSFFAFVLEYIIYFDTKNPIMGAGSVINHYERWISKAKTKQNECCVCMENVADIHFSPCKHTVTCFKCQDKIEICPICRAKIIKASTVLNL